LQSCSSLACQPASQPEDCKSSRTRARTPKQYSSTE
jgi:hypothetical protein